MPSAVARPKPNPSLVIRPTTFFFVLPKSSAISVNQRLRLDFLEMKRHYSVPNRRMFSRRRYLPFALVEVSHANKLELLEKGISASQGALSQTQDMLAHLREFQPSMAHLFQPKGIAISHTPLRLLCEGSKQLQPDSSPRFESYIALSYCWHSPNWPLAKCLGRPALSWPISTAMVHGLLEQRESTEEGIWIDQCCINQQDPAEKQLAIGCMDLIYRSARKVVAILEDISISKKEKILLQTIDYGCERTHADLNVLADVLIRILSCRWFKRAWCSHELQLSKDLIFLLPARPTPVELTPDGLETLYSVTSDYMHQREDLVARMVDNGVFRSYDFFTRTIDRKDKRAVGRSLISEFSDIDQLACSSLTDVPCIAMNIAELQVYFTGHVRSRNECRWVLAMVALSAGDATVLDGVDEILRVEDDASTPSWLNWANDLEDTMTRVGYSKLRRPMCIESIDQYQITLDLLLFTDTNLQHPSKYFYHKAGLLMSSLFKTLVNDHPDDQPYWMKPTDNPIERRREQDFVTVILACSLDCGFDWMIKQMTSAPDLAIYIERYLADFESKFWPILDEHVLSDKLPGSLQPTKFDMKQKHSIVQYIYFILSDDFLELGSFPLFLPTISRASSEEDQVPLRQKDHKKVQCMWLDLGSGNKALVATRPGVVGRCRLTVPIALSNGSCAGIKRLWLLKSYYEGEEKIQRLTQKYHMFTLMPIEENVNVVLKRHQIIRQ